MKFDNQILNQINQKYSAEKLLFFADYNNWYNFITKKTGSIVSGTYTWTLPKLIYKQLLVVGIGGGGGGAGDSIDGNYGQETAIHINSIYTTPTFNFIGGDGGKATGNGGDSPNSIVKFFNNTSRLIVPTASGGIYNDSSNGGDGNYQFLDYGFLGFSMMSGGAGSGIGAAYKGGKSFMVGLGGQGNSTIGGGGAGGGIAGGNGGNTATSGSNATGYGSGGGGAGGWSSYGHGGGGSGQLTKCFLPMHNVTNSTLIIISVGAGGLGGTSVNGNVGGNGYPGAIWIYGII